jgi:hypothetical protein
MPRASSFCFWPEYRPDPVHVRTHLLDRGAAVGHGLGQAVAHKFILLGDGGVTAPYPGPVACRKRVPTDLGSLSLDAAAPALPYTSVLAICTLEVEDIEQTASSRTGHIRWVQLADLAWRPPRGNGHLPLCDPGATAALMH